MENRRRELELDEAERIAYQYNVKLHAKRKNLPHKAEVATDEEIAREEADSLEACKTEELEARAYNRNAHSMLPYKEYFNVLSFEEKAKNLLGSHDAVILKSTWDELAKLLLEWTKRIMSEIFALHNEWIQSNGLRISPGQQHVPFVPISLVNEVLEMNGFTSAADNAYMTSEDK